MTKLRHRSISLAFAMLLLAGGARAQTAEIEIGYRWLDLDGSEAMYRTQINERSGFVLRAFTMLSSSESAAADRFRIDAVDLGSSPSGALRLEAERDGSYLLRIGYRAADVYSALPGFANPLLSQGIVPGQHTFDRNRTTFDADLEFIPGRRFSPFIGYTYHRSEGPGRTTYSIGQDEFRLTSDLDDTEQEIRAGTSFRFRRIHGQITQGWRDFNGRERFELDAGEASGNNTVPILGRDITISSFTRDSRTDVSAPFTNAFVIGEVNPRLRLVGSFVHLSAETDGLEDEALSGSLASFALGRFFGGLDESIDSRASNTTWRGEGRAEFSLRDGIDLIATYRKRHRELDGAAALRSLFIDTVTFAGADRRDLEQIHDARNAIERDDDILGVMVAARALGPFSIRAGYRQTMEEVTLIPDISQIVVAGNDRGTFERTVRTFDTTGLFARGGLSVGATLQFDRADEAIFRTDFTDRDRFRLRAAFARPRFRIAATAEQIDRRNDIEPIALDNQTRMYSGDFTVAPIAGLELFASASRFDVDHLFSIRRPQTFVIDTSIYLEEGTAFDGGVSFFRGPFLVNVSGGRFENDGTTPFQIDRFRARVVYDFRPATGIAAEWSRDDYAEDGARFGNFDASRYGLFLRYRR
ncbi:MAG TPA: hypothetical protein VM779_10365 [Thermoanaerobaculia bacterium]|nr:hypothetical protein [Thermoanaerobaculia bacterium]